MIHSLSPVSRRGASWSWVLVLILLGPASEGFGQGVPKKEDGTPKKGAEASTKKASGAAAKGEDTPKAKEEAAKAAAEADAAVKAEEAPVESTTIEVFKDPRAEEALTKQKPIPGLRASRPADVTAVKAMAAGAANVDPDLLQRFVDGMAFQLVDASNIRNMTAPPPGPITRNSLNIQIAVDNLIDMINIAKATNNAAFLKVYNPLLIATLPKLLDNHLFSRIQAMIVLGQVPSADILPILLAQLKDKNQTIWVKLWAMKGLSNLVQDGVTVTSVLGADRSYTAAKAVLDCLQAEEDMPWPAKMRAVEALGALRQSAGPADREKADMATAVMGVLADPAQKPEVRAAAGWALGMLQINPGIAKYNFPLIGYWVGSLTADIGDSILKGFQSNKTDSEYLTGLLVGPIAQAFNGLEGARESGLLNVSNAHPNVAPSLTYLRQILDLDTNVSRSALELIRSPKAQYPARLKDLTAKVVALRAFLEKTPPKDFHLIPPNGPLFDVKPAEPAEKPAAEVAEGAKDAAAPASAGK